MPECNLCLSDAAATAMTRISGLDVCEGCMSGHLTHRLAHRGIQLDFKATSYTVGGGRTSPRETVYQINVEGQCPARPPLDLRFSREGISKKLAKLFVREIQVGDPLFDDSVYVKSKGDDQVARRFLASEGVQMAVMDLIGTSGWLSIVGGHIKAQGVERSIINPHTYALHAAAMLCYLSQLGGAVLPETSTE